MDYLRSDLIAFAAPATLPVTMAGWWGRVSQVTLSLSGGNLPVVDAPTQMGV
ncbi:MAG TPA: hypothetical protein VFC03_13650 [Acidimicrobiales bacterium]|nr:hypothetical protein [Acidimicrobiales bacterium]